MSGTKDHLGRHSSRQSSRATCTPNRSHLHTCDSVCYRCHSHLYTDRSSETSHEAQVYDDFGNSRICGCRQIYAAGVDKTPFKISKACLVIPPLVILTCATYMVDHPRNHYRYHLGKDILVSSQTRTMAVCVGVARASPCQVEVQKEDSRCHEARENHLRARFRSP